MNDKRVMLLIDADNVSAEVIEQALAQVIQAHGAAHVRRAYCSAEAAVKLAKLFKGLSIRPMVNIASGKNCTDIALAVDAIDLALSERPDIAVIVSSDSDFAPLVLRLREKGCRVEGYGQQGKTSEDTKPVYDAFVDLAHGKARPRAAVAAPAKAAARAPRGAKPAVVAKPVLPAKVQEILRALPALARGESVELRVAAEALRKAELLSRNGSSTKFFGQYPEHFALRPAKQPNHVSALLAGAT